MASKHSLGECAPGNEFHCQEWADKRVFAKLIQGDDVGVLKSCCGIGFLSHSVKRFPPNGVLAIALVPKEFHSNSSTRGMLHGFPHRTHSTNADDPFKRVTGNCRRCSRIDIVCNCTMMGAGFVGNHAHKHLLHFLLAGVTRVEVILGFECRVTMRTIGRVEETRDFQMREAAGHADSLWGLEAEKFLPLLFDFALHGICDLPGIERIQSVPFTDRFCALAGEDRHGDVPVAGGNLCSHCFHRVFLIVIKNGTEQVCDIV